MKIKWYNPVLWLAFFLVSLVVLYNARGADVTIVHHINPGYDSLHVYLWVDGANSADSAVTPPDSIVWTLDNTTDCMFIYWAYDGADSIPGTEPLPFASYQGSASSLTAAIVADTLGGRYGTGAWDGAGTGTYSVTFNAYDTSNSEVVNGVGVAVWNTGQTNQLATGQTDVDGDVSFNLDSGDVVVIMTAPGYTFPTYDTITVDSSEVDTVSGYTWEATAASGADLCAVYGRLFGPDQDTSWAYGLEIKATLPTNALNHCDSSFILNRSIVTTVGVDGRFSMNLIKSKCLGRIGSSTSDTLKYTLTIQDISKEWPITVPDSASYKVIFQ